MVNPFLKWAGGKRWLTETSQLPVPSTFRHYVEPFLGGGAVFFHLQPRSAVLSDVNAELICLYTVMKKRPRQLYARMVDHQREHSKQYYYKVRSHSPKSMVETASRFLYLNRACWNGLYRVNCKGEFNVPIGTKESILFPSDDFVRISDLLKKADIVCADFEDIIDECEKGDFLFVDPPYTVKHNFNNFRRYNEHIFSWSDQIRLRDSLERAKERGVKFVATNADHECILDLYLKTAEYIQIHRSSRLAADFTKRGKTTEALFFANFRSDECYMLKSKQFPVELNF